MFTLRLLLLFSFYFSACHAENQHNNPNLNGAWAGKIGNANVHVCFDGSWPNYYYDKYLKHIPLDIGKEKNELLEYSMDGIGNSATWRITSIDNKRLEGEWVLDNNEKKAKIELLKVDSLKKDHTGNYSCSKKFYDPILKAFDRTTTSAQFKGIAIKNIKLSSTKKTDVEFSIRYLNFDAPEYSLVNQFINDGVEGDIIALYHCNGSPTGNDYETELTPHFKIKNILVLKSSISNYCGGTHPNFGYSYLNLDIHTGKVIDLWRFIKNKNVDAGCASDGKDCYSLTKASDKLNTLINHQQQKLKTSEDCMDTLKENHIYDIRISAKGLGFKSVLPHVSQACDAEVEIKLETLMPFLTNEGAAFLRQLINE